MFRQSVFISPEKWAKDQSSVHTVNVHDKKMFVHALPIPLEGPVGVLSGKLNIQDTCRPGGPVSHRGTKIILMFVPPLPDATRNADLATAALPPFSLIISEIAGLDGKAAEHISASAGHRVVRRISAMRSMRSWSGAGSTPSYDRCT